MLIAALILCFSSIAYPAEIPPMVIRHIFAPDSGSDHTDSTPDSKTTIGPSDLEKEILFTGVVISQKEKKVILSENAKSDKLKRIQVLKVGDQIKGMMIKEIGGNYVQLASKEETVRLKLYAGMKVRPAPAPEPEHKTAPNQELTAEGQNKNGAKNSPGPETGQDGAEKPSPFGGDKGGKKPPVDNPPAPNPFAEMLKNMGQNKSRPSGSPSALPFNLPAGN